MQHRPGKKRWRMGTVFDWQQHWQQDHSWQLHQFELCQWPDSWRFEHRWHYTWRCRVDELTCAADRGREVWLRLTLRPANLLK